MGPFTLDVAMQGEPAPKVKALLVLSHGIGGSELAHSALAEALARDGYLVAALRHPGDNWQDRSLSKKTPERYFDEWPRQVSRVIDALLADPRWKDRTASDDRARWWTRARPLGRRLHGAGAGRRRARPGSRRQALPRRSRRRPDLLRHRPLGADAAHAGLDVTPGPAGSGDRRHGPGGRDAHRQLARRRAPGDADLRGRARSFSGAAVSRRLDRENLPAANLRRVPNAWHFAFMDTPSMSIPTDNGDAVANPPGFDRGAFLKVLGSEIAAFFDKAFG